MNATLIFAAQTTGRTPPPFSVAIVIVGVCVVLTVRSVRADYREGHEINPLVILGLIAVFGILLTLAALSGR